MSAAMKLGLAALVTVLLTACTATVTGTGAPADMRGVTVTRLAAAQSFPNINIDLGALRASDRPRISAAAVVTAFCARMTAPCWTDGPAHLVLARLLRSDEGTTKGVRLVWLIEFLSLCIDVGGAAPLLGQTLAPRLALTCQNIVTIDATSGGGIGLYQY